MSLAQLLIDVVGIAKETVTEVLVSVTHRVEGAPTVNGPSYLHVVRTALHERKQTRVRLADGTETVASGTLTFLETVVVRAGDEFTLPDGSKAVVLDTASLDTPLGTPYAQVFLGPSAQRTA